VTVRTAVATILAVAIAASAHAYSGVGRAAVEKALGRLPQSEKELGREFDELEKRLESGDRSAATSYAAAILRLNKPHGCTLDEPRRRLGDAIIADPGYADALELWVDLNPTQDELQRVGEALEARRRAGGDDEAATLYASATALWLLDDYGDAARACDAAEGVDESYRGRCRWLMTIIAAERENDEEATRQFEQALDALDDATAHLIWASARFVATKSETSNYEVLAAVDRPDFLRSFWKRRDAFPLTDENERIGEHLRRLAFARREYALQSNGRAYLTMHDTFKDLSPDLTFYSSSPLFDYQTSMPTWIDHRGLIYMRHGKPDRSTRSSIGTRSETWLFHRWTTRPLMFHFIDRRGVGEFVIALNLGQATAKGVLEDDPTRLIGNAADFRELYATRSTFHMLFQRIATSRSVSGLEDSLNREAAMMAGFVREAFIDDTSNLLGREDVLPFAAYSANFRASDGKVDAFVYYAIPERELTDDDDDPRTVFEFDATIVVFSSNWQEKIATAQHSFRYERPTDREPAKDDLLVGVLNLYGLDPDSYNFAFQLRERGSGKIGIAKGQMITDYFGPEWVDVSDLLLAAEISPDGQGSIFERNGRKVVPIPTRTVRKKRQASIYYEIYDLQPGLDDKTHYRIEYRVLQVQKQRGMASKLFGIGMNVASLFFPYQVFLTQAGLFGLDVITNNPEKGLEIFIEEREATPIEGAVSEAYELDTAELDAGIYQVYVTVKDYVSGAISTRKMRFAVTN